MCLGTNMNCAIDNYMSIQNFYIQSCKLRNELIIYIPLVHNYTEYQ